MIGDVMDRTARDEGDERDAPGARRPPRIAITGGTGFVGHHLARFLVDHGCEVVLVARGVDRRPAAQEALGLDGVTSVAASIDDVAALRRAFAGCDAVAHLAGINAERGEQTYERVHVEGTRNVVLAAEAEGIDRLTLLSFLRARPASGSGYHDSKWAAEEIVRSSSLRWTVLKPGMIYGVGDHMLDHLSHAVFTVPLYVGIGPRPVRPLAVADVVRILHASLTTDRLEHRTVPIVGPDVLTFDHAVSRVASIVGRKPLFVRAPMAFHEVLAAVAERTMRVPMVSHAQVQILREGVVEPVLAPDDLPADLVPTTPFDERSIRAGLPEPGPFTGEDFTWVRGPRRDRSGRCAIRRGGGQPSSSYASGWRGWYRSIVPAAGTAIEHTMP
jgi:NADH dehydrogenase